MKFFVTLLLNLILLSYAPFSQAKTVIGWVEDITFYANGKEITLPAKIDSGADHSSLHATNILVFKKNNQRWIKFTTEHNLVLQIPLYKETKIKTKKVGHQTRPVILLEACIAGKIREIEVSLVNRSHFTKPLLIGRSALQGVLIDPNKTHLMTSIQCLP
ncbi:hypothetical protein JCM30760_00890 [Thiomicrorhabdus hydrogeniphila]